MSTPNRRLVVAWVTALLCLCVPLLLWAFPSNPPLGNTSAPGEGNCSSCHGGGAGGGNVRLAFSGGGSSYTPGTAQTITITTSDPNGSSAFGFEMTALEGSTAITPGTFASASSNVSAPATSGTKIYERQFSATSNTFSVNWTPPATSVYSGPVIFYVASLAGNGTQRAADSLYQATATLTAAGGGTTLSANPTSLSFSSAQNGPVPAAQTISLTSSGAALSYTVTSSTTSGGTWLSATPASSTSPGTETVSVNPTGLAPGTYHGTVTFASSGASNSPLSVPVTLVVAATPNLTLAPSALTFASQIGGTAPAPQSFSVGSTSTVLSYTVTTSTTSGGNWLSATPASGTTGTGTETVAVNTTGLAIGTYTGTVTVASTAAGNSPQIVAVTLNVTSGPALTVTPNSLTFNFQIGGVALAAQTFSVGSTGAALSYTATTSTTSGGNWLSATPTSSTTPRAEMVSVNTTGLAAGTYSGRVSIASAAAGNSPQTVAVTLNITAVPTFSLSGSVSANGAGATVSLTGAASATTTADAAGNYSFTSLAPSTYTVTPTLTGFSFSPATLSETISNTNLTGINFTASAVPPTTTLVATPSSLSFQSSGGGDDGGGRVAPQTIHLTSSNQSAVSFTTAALTSTGSTSTGGCNWLTVTPASGSAPASATVSVRSSGLPNGTYSGEILFSSSGAANNPLTVDVSFVVTNHASGDDAEEGGGGSFGTCNLWTTPAGTQQGTRFSTLNQINSNNVAQLTEEFHFATGVLAGHQGAPLVVGNTMYVVGPFPNQLFALDLAHPGTTKWIYSPNPSEYAKGQACCDIINRGAVFANGKILYNTLDNTVVAVDAATGSEVWRTSMGDVHTGQTMTMGPIVVGDKVFVGNAGAELGIRGWVAALNVNTGAKVWQAYSTGPDSDVLIGSRFKPFYSKDQGTNLGMTTWPGTLWQQGGGTVWAYLTYDPELNLLFEGTSNPGTWNPDIRPGDNKWGSTIFARDPNTGEAIWAYQMTPHDEWDFDSVNEDIAVDLPIQGTMRQLLVHFNKNGFAYTFDRLTGQILVAKPFAPENWADHIDLTTGLPAVNASKTVHTGQVTKDICPAPPGGKDMEPAAFSPLTRLFYIPSINICVDNEPLEVNFIEGTPFVGAMPTMYAGPGGNRGAFIAWDAVNGRQAWSITENFPLYGGALATAGNVVFYGTMDRWLKAVDATTGQVLFKTQLPSGIIGNPITFIGPDGKQRVAIYSGVGGYVGAIVSAPLAPDDPYAAFGITGATADLPQVTGPGGTVHVFKLP